MLTALSLIIAVAAWAMLSPVTQAAACQNALDKSVPIPSGYGASYNLFSPAGETLITGLDCTAETARVQMGSGAANQYIYTQGYLWNGSQWQPLSLTANGSPQTGAWFAGSAQAQVSLAKAPALVLGYICQFESGAWKCGCRDKACSTSQWQLQAILRPNEQGSTATHVRDLPNLYGVNVAGAEFGFDPWGKGDSKPYPRPWPPVSDADPYIAAGFNIIRLPFRWERVRPDPNGPLNAAQIASMDAHVANITAKGAYALLDMHNYAIYSPSGVTISPGTNWEQNISNFAYTWSEIAKRYKDNPRVQYDLMNEPKDTSQDVVRRAYQAAIDAIRATGAKQAIHIEGNGWGDYMDYTQNCWYGECNTAMFLKLNDPEKNLVLHAHTYYVLCDNDTACQCDDVNRLAKVAAPLTAWARSNGVKLFSGEFYWPDDNAQCLQASKNALRYFKDNKDVWLGWTYWAAGTLWPAGSKALNTFGDPQVPVLLDALR